MDTFWHLEKEDFFKGIDEAKSAFLKNAQRLELSKNEMVFLEGDAGDSCFYIESGLIRIFCMDRAGKEMTFSLRMKGEIFGISEVLNNSPRKASAQTASASVLYAINRQDFESMLQEHYPLARSVITLLGRRLRYAVEDPGYRKISGIYAANDVTVCPIGLDSEGLSVEALRASGAQIAHISPAHHYPTGIVMPIRRRNALLAWAAEAPERYIIEDDYDSELRHTGLPVPPLFSLDGQGRVLYLSTFSQTIAPSLRIAYLCLPPRLMERLRTQLGFYACAVPSFEQFTLARFIASGDYERHLNRLRKRFREKRAAILAAIAASSLAQRCEIIEENAGTHFLLRLATSRSDAELKRSAAECGLSLRFLSDYRSDGKNSGCAIVNYACMPTERLPAALETLAELL